MFKVRNLRKTHQAITKKDKTFNIFRHALILTMEGLLSNVIFLYIKQHLKTIKTQLRNEKAN